MVLAPFKELRYIMACFPVFVLVIPFVISFLGKRVKIVAVTVISVIYAYNAVTCTERVENLFPDQEKNSEFLRNNAKTDVLVLGEKDWVVMRMAHLMPDNQNYIFPHSIESSKKILNNTNKIIVLFYKGFTEKVVNDIPPDFKILSEDSCCGVTGYHLVKQGN
ncbi:hypothetical protein FACS189449_08710 [Alphaproteobacteria bacterium]|nr:hypothetical protein FACS189449_08710 [Alphaproteobacteria bacterium]